MYRTFLIESTRRYARSQLREYHYLDSKLPYVDMAHKYVYYSNKQRQRSTYIPAEVEWDLHDWINQLNHCEYQRNNGKSIMTFILSPLSLCADILFECPAHSSKICPSQLQRMHALVSGRTKLSTFPFCHPKLAAMRWLAGSD